MICFRAVVDATLPCAGQLDRETRFRPLRGCPDADFVRFPGGWMRRLGTLLVTVALAGGLAISVGAAPAQATVLRNVYYGWDDCYRYGNSGVQNGYWPSFTCTFVSNGSSSPPYGFWFLYA
jgi:hypothetical protein